MSEAKHTPGPWEFSDDVGHHHGHLLIHGPDGHLVADAGRILRRTPEEMAANARLIAVAPDLLSACKGMADRLTEYCEELKQAGMESEASNVRMIANTLANAARKATGE